MVRGGFVLRFCHRRSKFLFSMPYQFIKKIHIIILICRLQLILLATIIIFSSKFLFFEFHLINFTTVSFLYSFLRFVAKITCVLASFSIVFSSRLLNFRQLLSKISFYRFCSSLTAVYVIFIVSMHSFG